MNHGKYVKRLIFNPYQDILPINVIVILKLFCKSNSVQIQSIFSSNSPLQLKNHPIRFSSDYS